LRQCDGAHVQCLVLVRDDFWMAVTRFLAELEVDLVQGRNAAAVDLFPPRHAEKVLTAFGRAYGALPDNPVNDTPEQREFIQQAIAGLAEDGKVICVRLALFAEMMKARPWTPAALQAVGGASGVGVAFLEETFSAPGANPAHRLHQHAARAVLKALLPEAGTDIKGHMQPRERLLEASGYATRPRDFETLLRILDTELRLITPTEPESADPASVEALARRGAAEPTSGLRPDARQYQLTHDYLVPSLRDWLTRKQRETRRGRAELRLAERAAMWYSKPEKRQLPSLLEWIQIRCLTRTPDWTQPQKIMMRKAAFCHGSRGLLVLLTLLLLGWGVWEFLMLSAAWSFYDDVFLADTTNLPTVIHSYRYDWARTQRPWADSWLREALEEAKRTNDPRRQLHASLALLPVDPGQVDYLCGCLFDAKAPDEVKTIRYMLNRYAPTETKPFWALERTDPLERDPAKQLRAACALAVLDSNNPRWRNFAEDVVVSMAAESIHLIPAWAELLEPVQAHLLPHQVRHLMEANAAEFSAYLAMLPESKDATAELEKVLDQRPAKDAKQEERQTLARQQAQTATALLARRTPARVWPLFRHSEDPTCRTYLIHNCSALGVDPKILLDRIRGHWRKLDPSELQGLYLALGEYGKKLDSFFIASQLYASATTDFEDHPDPGVHSATEWLLRRMGHADRLAEMQKELSEAGAGIIQGKIDKPRWYVNGQGQTFTVIPAPGKFTIGSPQDERGRNDEDEDQRELQIDYAFAVATKLVTVAEFQKCLPGFQHHRQSSPGQDTPINAVSWYDAARYCNWLSEKEGIPEDQWCYERNSKGEYDEGMKVNANYEKLSGYRLPREMEWEYACRAGTVTAWSYGNDESMLGQYAWYNVNSGQIMHPVGLLKPNGLGLFDMHGNAWQWCQEVQVGKENKDTTDVQNNDIRVLRGGSFLNGYGLVRSAYRLKLEPAVRNIFSGFRVARTIR
jgi:formylglycine-generating enzyme required for sulfatase activity